MIVNKPIWGYVFCCAGKCQIVIIFNSVAKYTFTSLTKKIMLSNFADTNFSCKISFILSVISRT